MSVLAMQTRSTINPITSTFFYCNILTNHIRGILFYKMYIVGSILSEVTQRRNFAKSNLHA